MKQTIQYAGYVLFVVVGGIALLFLRDRNEWQQMATTAAATTVAISTHYAETETNAQAVQETATTASVSARATVIAGNAAAATLESQLLETQSLADARLNTQTTLETELGQQHQISQAYELALASQQLLNSSEPNSELSALLAVEAIRLYQNPYTVNALSRAVSLLPKLEREMGTAHTDASELWFSQDGGSLLTWGWNTALNLWDTNTGERLSVTGDTWVSDLSANGHYLAIRSQPAQVFDTTSGQEVVTLPRSTFGLEASFSPDSTLIAYSTDVEIVLGTTNGGRDFEHIIVVQDIQSGEEILQGVIEPERENSKDSYERIAFSWDNRYVAGANLWRIDIWDITTGQNVMQIPISVSWPDHLVFSPDNTYIAATGFNGTAIWNLVENREVPIQPLHGTVHAVRFSADGRYLVVTRQEKWDAGEGGAWYTGQNGTQVWDVATGMEVLYLPQVNNDASFINDTDQLLTLDRSGGVQIWDVVTRKLVAQAQISGQITTGINTKGTRIASIDGQGRIRLWAIEPYPVTQILHPMTIYNADYREPDNLNLLTYSPDGLTLVTSSWDGQVRFWDSTNGDELDAFESRSTIDSLIFNADGSYLAIGGGNYPSPAPGWIPAGLTRIWEQSAGVTISLTHELELNDVEFSPNGQIFATASTLTQIWDTNTGTELLACAPEVDPLDLAFTPNGNDLIVLTEDRAVICDVRTGEIRPLFSATVGSRYRVMTLHPNDRLLAVTETSHILLWDITTNMQVYDLVIPDDNPQLKLIFSEGGEYLGLFSPRKSLTIWDTSTWQEVLQVRDNLLNDFAFSPDSYYVVLGYFGGEARVLTLSDGIEVNRLVYDANIAQVAFHPNGQQVALLGQYESVVLWNWNPGEWVQGVCGRVSRNLTYEEWRTYFGYELYHQTCLNLPAPSAP